MPGLTRKSLREAVRARLVAAGVAPVGDVYTSRAQPLPEDHAAPVLLVYTPTESSERKSLGAPEFRRTTEVAVDAVLRGTADADLDDDLDDLGDAIEDAVCTDPAFLALFDHVEKIDRDSDIDVDNNRRRGVLRIAFSVTYDVVFEPVNIEADLLEVGVTLRPYDEATALPVPATDPVAGGPIELDGPP